LFKLGNQSLKRGLHITDLREGKGKGRRSRNN